MASLLRALPRGRSSGLLQRAFTTTAAADVSKEEAMRKVLQTKLTANFVKVEDVSGGCGAMYKIEVESPEFLGKSLVNQHKLVTNALKTEIGEMHGLTIQTRRPPQTD